MKFMCNDSRLRHGFTIVELLVTVGIVGIIAAVAVPRFTGRAARARQTEAKTNLANLAALERSYLVQASSFTSCIETIGFTPTRPTQEQRAYAIGLTDAVATQTTCGPLGNLACNQTFYKGSLATLTSACDALKPATAFYAEKNQKANSLISNDAQFSAVAAAVGVTPQMSQVSFRFIAVGSIHPTSTQTYDVWTIDNLAQLQNNVSGL